MNSANDFDLPPSYINILKHWIVPSGKWPLPYSEAANLMSQDIVGTSHSAPYKSTTVCFGNTFAYDRCVSLILYR